MSIQSSKKSSLTHSKLLSEDFLLSKDGFMTDSCSENFILSEDGSLTDPTPFDEDLKLSVQELDKTISIVDTALHHKFDFNQSFGDAENDELKNIHDKLMKCLLESDKITRGLLVKFVTPPPRPLTPPPPVPDITIEGSEGVYVDLKRLQDSEKDNAALQKKIFESERQKLAEKRHSLRLEMKALEKQLGVLLCERQTLCKKAEAVNSAPVYKCTVEVGTVFKPKK